MFRFLNLILAVLILLLQVRLWWGESSLPETWQLESRIKAEQEKSAVLAARNAILAAEVADLQSGLDAIEERARYELGMVRQNETFFLLIDKPADPEPAPRVNQAAHSALDKPEVVLQ